jgi:hypothetical protein
MEAGTRPTVSRTRGLLVPPWGRPRWGAGGMEEGQELGEDVPLSTHEAMASSEPGAASSVTQPSRARLLAHSSALLLPRVLGERF